MVAKTLLSRIDQEKIGGMPFLIDTASWHCALQSICSWPECLHMVKTSWGGGMCNLSNS